MYILCYIIITRKHFHPQKTSSLTQVQEALRVSPLSNVATIPPTSRQAVLLHQIYDGSSNSDNNSQFSTILNLLPSRKTFSKRFNQQIMRTAINFKPEQADCRGHLLLCLPLYTAYH